MTESKQQFSNILNEKHVEDELKQANLLKKEEEDFNNKVNTLMQDYNKLLFQKDDIYKTGVVGELKAGKSTFLNSILGSSILHTKSMAATAFPLRIVQKEETKGINLKYFYNENIIQKLKRNLESDNLLDDEKNLILDLIDSNIDEVYTNLNSSDIFTKVETLNNILRIVDHNKIIPIEELLTSIVPEITLNFNSYDIHNLNNPMDNTVLIDTPGIGEQGDLNKVFKKLTEHIVKHLDHTIVILEHGGRNTASEDDVKKMLEKSKSFSVIASKLDKYQEDIKNLLENSLPNKFENCNIPHNIFGVSQHQFLMANKILNDFNNHGKIIDTREPYIATIINEVYNKKDVKKYSNQTDGYEELLNKNDDFMQVINDDYLNNDYQQINQFLEYLQLESLKAYNNILHNDTVKKMKLIEVEISNSDIQTPTRIGYIINRSLQCLHLKSLKFYKKDLHNDVTNRKDQLFNEMIYNLFTFEVCNKISNGSNYKSITKLIKYAQTQLINGDKFKYKQNIHKKDLRDFANIFKTYILAYELSDIRRLNFLYQKLMEQYRHFADLGDSSAMYRIGLAYENGYGVSKDYDMAMTWYQKSADLGNIEALDLLKALNQKKIDQDNAKKQLEQDKAKKQLDQDNKAKKLDQDSTANNTGLDSTANKVGQDSTANTVGQDSTTKKSKNVKKKGTIKGKIFGIIIILAILYFAHLLKIRLLEIHSFKEAMQFIHIPNRIIEISSFKEAMQFIHIPNSILEINSFKSAMRFIHIPNRILAINSFKSAMQFIKESSWIMILVYIISAIILLRLLPKILKWIILKLPLTILRLIIFLLIAILRLIFVTLLPTILRLTVILFALYLIWKLI